MKWWKWAKSMMRESESQLEATLSTSSLTNHQWEHLSRECQIPNQLLSDHSQGAPSSPIIRSTAILHSQKSGECIKEAKCLILWVNARSKWALLNQRGGLQCHFKMLCCASNQIKNWFCTKVRKIHSRIQNCRLINCISHSILRVCRHTVLSNNVIKVKIVGRYVF